MTELMLFESSDLALLPDDQKRVIDNLTELHKKVLAKLAKNTRKAYLSDFAQYLSFCREHGLVSMASDWRKTKHSLERYFDYMMDSQLKHHSIKRKFASIRFFMQVAELPDPFRHSKLLRMYFKGIKEKQAAQKQAPALTLELVNRITEIYPRDSLLALRNIAILNVGIDSLLRASNLVAIKCEHINWDKGTIFVPYSKTDQEGKGHYSYISKETQSLVKRWMEAAGIEQGFLFRALSPKQTVRDISITTRTLWGVYRELGGLLKDGNQYSCHSTRTGAVITMVEREIPMMDIVKSGGWKSEAMPIRYAEQYQAAKTGMAKVR